MTTSHRLSGFILLCLGTALVLASIFADALGVSGGGEGVGWKQLIAAIGGIIVLLLGLALLLRHNEDNLNTGSTETMVPKR